MSMAVTAAMVGPQVLLGIKVSVAHLAMIRDHGVIPSRAGLEPPGMTAQMETQVVTALKDLLVYSAYNPLPFPTGTRFSINRGLYGLNLRVELSVHE